MAFLQAMEGYTRLDWLRNVDTRDELGVNTVMDGIKNYQQRCKTHVERMPIGRISHAALKYKHVG